jgi:hypothetical protein
LRALDNRKAGVGEERPSHAVAAAIAASWKPEDTKTYKSGPPVAVGDVWGLRAHAVEEPSAVPLMGIAAPVTLELWAKRWPRMSGALGLTGGTGTVEVAKAWVDPAPPAARPARVELNFPSDGEGKGKCTVELAKGWKWKATAGPTVPAYSEGHVGPFGVPGRGNLRIGSPLKALLCLRIRTLAPGREDQPAQVELHRRAVQDVWLPVDTGETTQQLNGEQVWTYPQPLFPGTYRVRARAMAGPWSGWEEFGLAIGVEVTKIITVPQG